MIAFNGNDNQILAAFFHILVHSPGFSVSCVLVKKDVVTVEHVHDRIAAVGILLVGGRQIHVGFPGRVSGKLGNGNIPFDNHVFQTSFLIIFPWKLGNSIIGKNGIVNRLRKISLSDENKSPQGGDIWHFCHGASIEIRSSAKNCRKAVGRAALDWISPAVIHVKDGEGSLTSR